jgi:hypothetical protein
MHKFVRLQVARAISAQEGDDRDGALYADHQGVTVRSRGIQWAAGRL